MSFIVGELAAPVTADTKGFTTGMAAVKKMGSRTADQIQRKFRDVGRQMTRIGSQLTKGLTLPLVGAGGLALKTAADYESLRQSMNALNGSAEEGARNFQRLKKFSAETPFQLKDLADAQNMLQGFGASANDAFKYVKQIGDIAAITGADIKGIGIAFGQSAASGQLMTRDIRQLINQGVPALKLLAKTMDVPKSAIFDLASQGKITFDILEQAFTEATNKGGMFADGMKKQAGTLKGVFSTLKDNVSIALGAIGDSLEKTFHIKDLMKGLIDDIQQGIDWFDSLSQQTKEAAFIMAGVLGASGPIIAALGTLSLAIGAISAPIAGMVAAVAGGAAFIMSNWDEVKAYFTTGDGAKMWDDLKNIVDNTITIIQGLWRKFGDNIIGFTEGAFSTILEIVKTTLDAINSFIQTWADIYNGEYQKAFTDAEDGWQKHMGNIKNIVQTGLLALKNIDVIGGYKLWEYLGLIPDQKELNKQMQQRMKQSLADARKVVKPEDVIIPAKIDVSMPGIDLGKKIFIPPQHVPVSIDKPDLKSLKENLPTIDDLTKGINFDLGDKILPPGSLGALQERLQTLRSQMQFAFTPEQIDALQQKISLTKEQIAQLTGQTQQSGQAMAGLAQSLGTIFEQAALHGRSLLEVVENLAKQLAARAFIKGLTLILSGGTSGGSGFIGGLMKDILGFAGGGRPPMGRPSIVGENGPELWMPDSAGTIIPNHALAGGRQQKQIIENNLFLDGRQLEIALENQKYKRNR